MIGKNSGECWQSKEFDGALGNYYFGARYYDPLLGLWMSPDPAGQFSNPYGYGGDPVNYVDPTGMWALGLGIVVGWDSQHGWQIGFGAALDLSNGSPGNGFGANLSYTWNQDDSESFNMGASGQYLWLAGGLSYSYNSYTGQTFSGNIGVCVGLKGVVSVGPEIGGSLYVNHEGDIMGATAYAELQASAFGGLTSAVVGYESGSVGMEGRGLFAGATVAGVHAEITGLQDGFDGARGSIGFQEKLFVGIGNNSSSLAADGTTASMVKWELWMPTLGNFGHFTFGNGYDVSPEGSGDAQDAYFEKNKINDKKRGIVLKRDIETKNGKHLYSDAMVAKIHKAMMENGYSLKIEKANTFWNRHEGDKYTYYKDGSRGNVEIIKIAGNNSYASFNYGNNFLTHFLIDYLGYTWRNY